MRDKIIQSLSKLWVKLVVIAVTIVFVVVYLMIFSQTGMEIRGDIFMKSSAIEGGIEYTGKFHGKDVYIEVIDNSESDFSVKTLLPTGVVEKFDVRIGEEMEHEIEYGGSETEPSKSITTVGRQVEFIDENGEVYFDEIHVGNTGFIENMLTGSIISISSSSSYDVEKEIAEFEFSEYVIMDAIYRDVGLRNNAIFLALAILLLIMFLIDFFKPRLFFNIKYMWNVENAEPSEFFLGMQKLSWVVMPIVIIILLIVAIV